MRLASLAALALVLAPQGGEPMQLHRAWTDQHWCASVRDPHWPLVYSKSGGSVEWKGRTASNERNFGHVCETRGVQSKCHRCEDIECGVGLDQTCNFQVQGTDWSALKPNGASVSDFPWAVGGAHRSDYAGGSHVCLMVSGGDCIDGTHPSKDFRECKTRCWGAGGGVASPVDPNYANRTIIEEADETVEWEWDESALSVRPQGKVLLLAGASDGSRGHRDGASDQALFDTPAGIAVDADGNVFVADSGNHCIRRIDKASGEVSTIAGVPGQSGLKDGLAAGEALFDGPTGLTLYYDWGAKLDSRTGTPISAGIGELVLVVSDTNNHRLRRIVFSSGPLRVETLAGRRGESVQAGYSDGDSTEARFNYPAGIAADDSGIVFVADSHNHLIRRVTPDGDVITLAGSVQRVTGVDPADPASLESCPPPCLEGVPGYADGPLRDSKFFFPTDVAIGLENTLVVADANRIRRVTRASTTSEIQGQVFTDSVSTIAGDTASESNGKVDGVGSEATFNAPAAVTMDTNTGRVFVADTGSCRLRRITPAAQVARLVSCSTTLVELVRPSGCTSYETPVDELFLKATDVTGNVHYNYASRSEERGVQNGWAHAAHAYKGRRIHRCQGSPPPERGEELTGSTSGPRQDTESSALVVDEDTDQGTAIYVRCPASCAGETSSAVFGDGGGGAAATGYTDESSVCRAALHAGSIADDSVGGLVRLVLVPGTESDYAGSSGAHGVNSTPQPGGWHRGFVTESYPEADVQVATIAGHPAAALEEGCGVPGAPAMGYLLPLEARFNLPQGVAIAANVSLDQGANMLYVSDTANHAIRALTAVCAKICENGGECVGDEQCQCRPGWTGDDCSQPDCSGSPCSGAREVCVGPDQCDCIPGYTGFPACTQALCVQTCANGGSCAAPDTCACSSGWLDANCTTPVCSQTCGNGGNCTAPDTCRCPSDWTGPDCRTPVCRQTCANGGECIAPDTCACTEFWSGHDCSLPVCTQGFVVSDPSAYFGSSEAQQRRISDAAMRPLSQEMGYATAGELAGTHWRQFLPCDDSFSPATSWCNETNEFDCTQEARTVEAAPALRGAKWRPITGFYDGDGSAVNSSSSSSSGGECVRLELSIGTRTPFPYETEAAPNHLTDLWRYTPSTPYGWNASFAPGPDTAADWRGGVRGWRAPGPAASDRMVAHAKWASVGQGVYVCANGGNCTAPGVCKCAPGWIGFDCRIPVCEQGYYEPPSAAHPGFVEFEDDQLEPERFPDQGLYECSVRSVTQWENETFLFEHPNYYSRYMDHHPDKWSPARYQLEPETPYYWDNMGWPAIYVHTVPDGNQTNKGWTRKGVWERIPGTSWKKGNCTVEFARVCPGTPGKALDVRTLQHGSPVLDTDPAFRAVVFQTDKRTDAVGRWHEAGGVCVDQVLRGCKNNGTCVAPNTCECAPGWSGPDCTVPVCSQTCSRDDSDDFGYDNNNLKIFERGKGWCTLPDTCTCEKGWAGHDCSVALCAQECNNEGKCTAPDTCTCPRWRSAFKDGQRDGGHPLFQDDQGDPMLTGWTGYDCNTPICVQAERFVPNDWDGTVRLGGYGLILHGEEPYNNLMRPDLRSPPYLPYRLSNDIPPVQIWIQEMREYNLALWALPQNFLDEDFRLCRMQKRLFCESFPDASPLLPTWAPGDGEVVRNDGRSFQTGCKKWSGRFSDALEGVQPGYLCGVMLWEQGDYDEGRYIRQNNDATSYVRNESLSFSEARSTKPQWYKENFVPSGEGIYECYNKGSCIAPDTCSCPDGFSGTDCSTPHCRHRQADGTVVGCLNGGSCDGKDQCTCKQTDSVLYKSHPENRKLAGAKTGFTGTDCSIPMCAQGTFDPLCDLVTPGGEGCFRCKNGGNCTAPDFCTCPPEWTGYDCGTPVCVLRADEQIVDELLTSDPVKVQAFENDPCQNSKQFLWNGFYSSQGNCTAPNTCTCMCKERAWLDEDGEWTVEPWSHPLGGQPPLGSIFGTLQCVDGFEGSKNRETGKFSSCHLQIYVPKWYEKHAITMIVLSCVLFLCGVAGTIVIRRRIRQRYLLARAERRLTIADDEVVPLKKRKKTKIGKNKEGKKKKRRTNRKAV